MNKKELMKIIVQVWVFMGLIGCMFISVSLTNHLPIDVEKIKLLFTALAGLGLFLSIIIIEGDFAISSELNRMRKIFGINDEEWKNMKNRIEN